VTGGENMADKVKVIDSEYSDLESKLADAHSQVSQEISNALGRLSALCVPEGGFYMDSVSPKISSMISSIRTAASTLDAVYQQGESIVKGFAQAMDDIDTLS
jgi:hypothetical protein